MDSTTALMVNAMQTIGRVEAKIEALEGVRSELDHLKGQFEGALQALSAKGVDVKIDTGDSVSVSNSSVGGDITGRDKTTSTGSSSKKWWAIVPAVLTAIVGLVKVLVDNGVI